MANTGGAFFSAKLPPMLGEDDKAVIRQYCLVWGSATLDAKDNVESVDESDRRRGKRRTVSFRVRYGEEPIRYPPGYVRQHGEKLKRVKFMKCRAMGFNASAAVMSAIEKNDMVLCLGRTVFHKFKNKKGQDASYYEMKVDLCIPMGLVGFLMRLYASPTINGIVDKDENAEADVWES